ncbi:hypothetical protein QC334_00540 [Streptomyces sp. DH18]|uniref:hypothetical protein n=1 Tax=Streptomyces sp. DH18 TaxID=3040126 RepID=UPI002442DE9B|nr:hypothetical protein [Streptomyces sp. DH18]MDG9681235.1 hypothetical protein [Streptomyces sp. DH18]
MQVDGDVHRLRPRASAGFVGPGVLSGTRVASAAIAIGIVTGVGIGIVYAEAEAEADADGADPAVSR